jgi:hypothetical protein
MKKLTLALSAIAAAFGASTANADISVSGSGSAAYINDAASNARLNVGQFVSFSMSTTTSNGVTISGGMGLSNTITTDAGQGVSGGQTLTFATGGATIVVGDVEAADTPGAVGGVVGGQIGDNGAFNSDAESGFGDDDGIGLSLSTALGGSTLSIVYVANDDFNTLGTINSAGAGDDAITSASITVPMGAYTVTAGVADSDTGESASGASVAAAVGGGTLTVGYSVQTLVDGTSDGAHNGGAASGDLAADGDTTQMGASYAMSLDADTSVSVGIQNTKDADNDSTSQFDASISRALGGGASVFLDIRSLSGDATQDGSAVAFGTSVSF